jgi:hypothetical protein
MLRQANPLLRTVEEALVLPDRDLSLEVIDQPTSGGERLASVWGSRRYDHREITDIQWSGAVVSRKFTLWKVLPDGADDALELGLGKGVS